MRWSGLPSVPFSERHHLPVTAGIYFVSADNQLLYIGQSCNIRDRWQSHHRHDEIANFNHVRIYWLDAPVKFLDVLEQALIAKLQPSLNRRSLQPPRRPTQEAKPAPSKPAPSKPRVDPYPSILAGEFKEAIALATERGDTEATALMQHWLDRDFVR